MNFVELISGKRNYQPQNYKNLKNVPNKQFLSSPNLIKQFGFWRDTDKDSYLNFEDCFPFDNTRHQPTIPQALQPPKAPQTIAAVRAAKQPSIITPTTAPDTVGKEAVDIEIAKAREKETQVQEQREAAFKELQSAFPTENIPSSRLQEFYREWDVKREIARAETQSLRNIKGMIGEGVVQKTELQRYIEQMKSGVPRELEIAQRRAQRRVKQKEIQKEEQEFQKILAIPGRQRTLAQSERLDQLFEKRGMVAYGVQIKREPIVKKSLIKEKSPIAIVEPFKPLPELPFKQAVKQTLTKLKIDIGKLGKKIIGKRELQKSIWGETYAVPDFVGGYGDVWRKVGSTEEEIEKKMTISPTLKRETFVPGMEKPKTLFELKQKNLLRYEDLSPILDLPEEVAVQTLSKNIARDVSQELNVKYQQQINQKRISVKEAEEKFTRDFEEIYQKRFEEQTKRYGTAKAIRGDPYLRRGRFIPKTTKFGLETAALVTPQTAIALGVTKLAIGAKKDVTIIDEQGRPVGIKISPETKEAMFAFGAGTIGTLAKMKNIEKSAVIDELTQLKKQPVKYLNLIKKGDTDTYVFKGYQQLGNLKNEITITGKIIKDETGRKFLQAGKGISTLSGEPTWKVLGGIEPTKIIAKQTFEVASKGMTFAVDDAGRVVASLARTKLRPQIGFGTMYRDTKLIGKDRVFLKFPSPKIRIEPTRQTKKVLKKLMKDLKIGGEDIEEVAGGIAYKIDEDLYLSISGELKRLGINVKREIPGTAGKVFEKITPEMLVEIDRPSAIGFTKIVRTPKRETVKFISPTDVKKTPLSKTFGVMETTKELGFEGLISPGIAKKGLDAPTKIITERLKPSRTMGGLISGIMKPSITKIPSEKIGLGTLGVLSTKFDRKEIEKEKQKTELKPALKSKVRERAVSLISPKLSKDIKPLIKEEFTTSILVPTQTKAKAKTDIQQTSGVSPIISPTITPKIPITTGIPLALGGLFFPGEEEEIKRQQNIGYHGYALEKGKYKKITDKPYQKQGALSKVARYIDKTLSAQGKVQPVKQTKTIKGKKKEVVKVFEKPLPKGDDYYLTNKFKFRDYKSRQGKIIPLKDKIIERQRYRLDSPKETKQIKIAKKQKGVGQFFGF